MLILTRHDCSAPTGILRMKRKIEAPLIEPGEKRPRKHFIRPLDTNKEYTHLILECDPSSNEAISLSKEHPSNWFYSDNNQSSDRDLLFKLNKIAPKDINKIHTELAVFAGNLYKLILRGAYPEFFVGEIDQYELLDDFKDPFVRVGKRVENSKLWRECFSIGDKDVYLFGKAYSLDEVDKIPLKGLTSALVAGLFLAEIDWNYENLLITDDGMVIKIDPGLCINNLFIEETKENILFKLKNLLQNYVFKINDESYFFDLKKHTTESSPENYYEDSDSDIPELIHENISILFNNQKELFHTLRTIIRLSEAIREQAKKDFSPEFADFSGKLVTLFLKRIDNFRKAAYSLEGFKEFMTPPPKYAQLLDHHFFNSPLPRIKENSNPNFVYIQDITLGGLS